MEWDGRSWSAVLEIEEPDNTEYHIDVFIDSLVVVKNVPDKCIGVHKKTVGDLLGEYVYYLENKKPNEKCIYAKRFGMDDDEFEKKFIILYERMIEKQPELVV